MSDHDDERQQWFRRLREHANESDKSWSAALGLSFFLGWLGVDRFYLGYPWLGLLKLFTFGGFLVWWCIDFVLILGGQMRDGEGGSLKRQPVK